MSFFNIIYTFFLSILYTKPCYNEPCYKEVVVYPINDMPVFLSLLQTKTRDLEKKNRDLTKQVKELSKGKKFSLLGYSNSQNSSPNLSS